MKLIIFIILIFSIESLESHEDKNYTFEYKNITVNFLSGYEYEEIKNAQIIGQYTSILADSLGYNGAIFLDFIHDYGHNFRGENHVYLSYGSSAYLGKYSLVKTDEDGSFKHITNQDTLIQDKDLKVFSHTYHPEERNDKKIVLRQFGFRFDISQSLNLLSYAIQKNSELRNLSMSDTLQINGKYEYYELETIQNSIIDSVINQQNKLVENILSIKIYRKPDKKNNSNLYSYFSENGKKCVFAKTNEQEIILDTLDHIFSFNPVYDFNKTLYVFEEKNLFRQYRFNNNNNPKIGKSKVHKLSVDEFELIENVNLSWLGKDIYQISFNHGFWIPDSDLHFHLVDDDVLISNFYEFLDSHRKQIER